jgi:putative ABC transport system ATP-binding protein
MESIMENVVLSTKKLCKSYPAGETRQHVLKDIDLEIYKGDFTIVMGASGAGKSTLLYDLSGMDKPDSGEIRFNDEEISKYSDDRLAVFRRKNCGFIFQQIYLIDNMSLMDNVLASGMLIPHHKQQLVEKARAAFNQVGLDEMLWRKFPSQISGGEGQRAAVVRAVINDPAIVFADEPTGALNSAFGKAVLDVLTAVNENGQSIIMVTHDITSARRGNRIIYLKDGIVCGECLLGRYRSGDKERQEKISAFLTEMDW